VWRTDPPSFTGGTVYCLICQELINLAPGNTFYRLRSGSVHLDHYGIQFEEDCFEDGEVIKWLCAECAQSKEAEPGYLDEEYCTLCGQPFEEDESGAIEVLVRMEEVRIRVGRTGLPSPDYRNAGHLHIICAIDDWDLPLWNWNLERDTPPCP
jgi:hypothetical protein